MSASFLTTIPIAIAAASVAVAAVSFIFGVSAWRREFVGKRRIELAEEVLALFYEAEDVIRAIRSPMASGGEGRTRERGENEDEDLAGLLDQAFVAFERYERHQEFFARLRATRYRFKAAFGVEAGKPFSDLDNAVQRILVAARMLGTSYWPRQGRPMSEERFKQHLDEMERLEADFWAMGKEDSLAEAVHAAVGKVEAIVGRVVVQTPKHWYDPRTWFAKAESAERIGRSA